VSLLSLLFISLGRHSLQCLTPHFFYLSDFLCPLFLVNSPIKIFPFGFHRLEGVTRGGPPSPLVTPLCRCNSMFSFCEVSDVCFFVSCIRRTWRRRCRCCWCWWCWVCSCSHRRLRSNVTCALIVIYRQEQHVKLEMFASKKLSPKVRSRFTVS